MASSIRVSYEGEMRNFLVYPGQPVEELKMVLLAAFDVEAQVVGLRDVEEDVHYPITLMTKAPGFFASKPFLELCVLPEEEDEDDDDNSADSEYETGYLTAGEVRASVPSPSSTGSPTQAKSGAMPTPPPSSTSLSTVAKQLEAAKELTNMGAYDMAALLRFFLAAASANGTLSRAAFMERFATLVDRCFDGAPPTAETAQMLAQEKTLANFLFGFFDVNGSGAVDLPELGAGLAVLCAGARDDKVASALALFDEDGDGFLELSELVRYLEATFRVLYAATPGTAVELRHTPKTIAQATAQQCFLDAGANSEQAVSAAYFQAWYNRGQGGGGGPAAAPAPALPPPPAPDHLPWPSLPPAPPPQSNSGNNNGGGGSFGFASPSFAEMSAATQLGTTPVDVVFHRLAHSANAQGLLTRGAFETCVFSFAEEPFYDGASIARVQPVLNCLFNVFDKDKSGAVSFDEVASGLSVLCGGTRDEKVEAAFQLFDTNGDGVISASEMQVYLASVFAVLFEASPDIGARLSVGAEDLATVTTEEAFALMDSDQDGYLTFDEFRAWYQKSGPGGEDDGDEDEEEEDEEEAEYDSQGQLVVRGFTLKELRDISGLGALPVHDVFGLFAAAANDAGEIDRDMFGECVAHVADNKLSAGTLDRITDELFEVFDADGNGLVDFTELASGLSVLCGGTRDDKVQAAFQLFDTNGDGVISLEEMTAYLSSVFKLVYATKPELYESLRCGPEELGIVTAQQAFADADANQDGSISFDEFQQWYQAGGFDALSGVGKVQGGNKTKASEPAALTLVAIKLATGLDQCEVDDVVELFVRGADSEGQIAQAAFVRCFQVLAAALESNGATVQGGPAERAQVHSQLFALFDPSGSGYADAIELISGLTVLCGGKRSEKVRAAFQLHDGDDDGCLSFDELCAYLASIYKVLYEGNRGAHAHGPAVQDTSTLAVATANAAFAALPAAVHRGTMSLEEFTHWYSTAPSFEVELGSVGESDQQGNGATPAMSMQRARWLLNLDRHSLNDVLDTLVEAGPDGHLTLEQFSHALLLLMRLGGNLDARSSSGATSREYSEALNLVEAIFEEFDVAGQGRVDLSQLTSGLSILFPVPMAAKVNFAFALYDADGDGLVSFSELVEYLASVFAVLFVSAPELRPSSSLNAEELAEATATQAFGEVGLTPQHKLPKHLFKAFVERGLGFS